MRLLSPTFLKTNILFLCLAFPALNNAQSAKTGDFQANQDVGPVLYPGSLEYDPQTGIYRLTGSGTNMWGTSDAFHYAWKSLQGESPPPPEGRGG